MKAVAILIASLLCACATTPGAVAGPVAGLGQTAYVDGLRIRPVEVVEDSRCPALVRCVWQGRLLVRTEISGSGWRQQRDLELAVPQAIHQYRVALIAAEPQQAAPGAMPPGAYRFHFTVSGR